MTDEIAYQTFKKTASRNQALNKYGSCEAFESSQQCKNRVICKLRSTFPSHGGPFSSYELCKEHMWKPHLPEDWFLMATLGKKVNIFVNMDKFEGEYGGGDRNMNEDYGNSLFESQNDKDKSEDGGNDDGNDGITIEGLPKILVRMVLGLVLGGDDAICR